VVTVVAVVTAPRCSDADLAALQQAAPAADPPAPSTLILHPPPPQVPQKAATAFTGLSIAAFSASALLCAATTTLTPGWSGPACAAAVLRSFGHLQLLAFMRHLGGGMPATVDAAAGSAEWTRLNWVPGQEYAHRFSATYGHLKPPPSAPLYPVGGRCRSGFGVLCFGVLCPYAGATKCA